MGSGQPQEEGAPWTAALNFTDKLIQREPSAERALKVCASACVCVCVTTSVFSLTSTYLLAFPAAHIAGCER